MDRRRFLGAAAATVAVGAVGGRLLSSGDGRTASVGPYGLPVDEIDGVRVPRGWVVQRVADFDADVTIGGVVAVDDERWRMLVHRLDGGVETLAFTNGVLTDRRRVGDTRRFVLGWASGGEWMAVAESTTDIVDVVSGDVVGQLPWDTIVSACADPLSGDLLFCDGTGSGRLYRKSFNVPAGLISAASVLGDDVNWVGTSHLPDRSPLTTALGVERLTNVGPCVASASASEVLIFDPASNLIVERCPGGNLDGLVGSARRNQLFVTSGRNTDVVADSSRVPFVEGGRVVAAAPDGRLYALAGQALIELTGPLPDNPRVARRRVRVPVSSDGFVRGGSFADQNFLEDEVMQAGANRDEQFDRRVYLAFDLSSLAPDDSIVAAHLRVFVKGAAATPAVYAVFATDDKPWDAATLTWNGRPEMLDRLDTYVVAADEPVIAESDVTAAVRPVRHPASGHPRDVVTLGIRQVTFGAEVGYVYSHRAGQGEYAAELTIDIETG